MKENKDTHEKRDANPIALVFKWAGRHRKYLVASVACATLSGLMVAVPYLAVFDVMHAVYLKTCTAELIAGDVGMLVRPVRLLGGPVAQGRLRGALRRALPHPRAPLEGPARRDGRAQHGKDQDGALR